MTTAPAWFNNPHPCDGHRNEMFVLSKLNNDGTPTAKALCHTCPDLQQCKTFARDMAIPYGVFGGEGPRSRHKHLDAQARQGAA